MADSLLSAVQVVEWGSFILARFCIKLLADLGTEVIKVEPPLTGEEAHHYGPFSNGIPDSKKRGLFMYLNANKYGVTINPSSLAAGRETFSKSLSRVAIIVHNYPPGLIRKYKLDFNSVRKINPRAIMTSITPFGLTGPYSGCERQIIGGYGWYKRKKPTLSSELSAMMHTL